MATLVPFRALRPVPEEAPRLCTPPYDVMSTEEARAMAEGNPLSFLRVTRAEIEFPPEADPYADAVYRRGAENLRALVAAGHLARDPEPRYYLYRLVMDGRAQTGLVAAASCAEYDAGIVKKHEKTRADKEDDRTRHIQILGAQTGPVFLLHRATPEIDALWNFIQQDPPEVDFTADDGVRHTAWAIADAPRLQRIRTLFADLPALYIADGHHRSAAAARIARERDRALHEAETSVTTARDRAEPPHRFFLAVTFPDTQLKILGYNRLVKDLAGLTPEDFLARLSTVAEALAPTDDALPTRTGEFTAYLAGKWRRFAWRPGVVPPANSASPADRLDVAVLQDSILAPILGIGDPRTDKRIAFVGGIRGTRELERQVESGAYAVAFAMHPVSTDELIAIADSDGIMPPKSTWFEPKLRDAMMVHCLDD